MLVAPLLALLCGGALGKALLPASNAALKTAGDLPVVAVACCGASRVGQSAVLAEALAAPSGSPVCLVQGPNSLVLVDVEGAGAADAPDGAAAVAACDAVALEVRFADLVDSAPFGLAQLLPLLRRSALLREVRPGPKVLLLTVTDFDSTEVSEAEVKAFAAKQLDELVAGLSGGDQAPSPLQLRCFFVPRTSAEGYEQSLARLAGALMDAASPSYVFANAGAPASAFLASLGRASELAPASSVPASPAEVHAAYQCAQLAEAAARDFQKAAGALRKASDAALLTDFGEQCTALIVSALERFDAESTSLTAAAPVGAARTALSEQLKRALYNPFRKQLQALQKQTLAKFRAKVQAQKPAANIEVTLKTLLSEAMTTFDAAAATLVPSETRWSYEHERRLVREGMDELAKLHVNTLQVQGLYLSTSEAKMPIDFSAHWLLPHPFGRDSRYDPVSASDAPAFKPTASPMKLKATDGYKPRSGLQDPSAMVFYDKMMQ